MSNSQRPPPGFGGMEIPPRPVAVDPAGEVVLTDAAITWLQEKLDHLTEEFAARISPLEDGNPLAAVEQLQGQLRALEETAAMHRDEIGKIVSACVLYEKTLKDFQAAIDALIRREISLGFGVKALEEANKSKGPADGAEQIVKKAQAFHKFLLSTLPQIPLISAAHAGNSVDELPGEHPLPKGELH